MPVAKRENAKRLMIAIAIQKMKFSPKDLRFLHSPKCTREWLSGHQLFGDGSIFHVLGFVSGKTFCNKKFFPITNMAKWSGGRKDKKVIATSEIRMNDLLDTLHHLTVLDSRNCVTWQDPVVTSDRGEVF